jgi:hypothetical protein
MSELLYTQEDLAAERDRFTGVIHAERRAERDRTSEVIWAREEVRVNMTAVKPAKAETLPAA